MRTAPAAWRPIQLVELALLVACATGPALVGAGTGATADVVPQPAETVLFQRNLLHAGVDHNAVIDPKERSYTWLIWTSGALLFVEGLIGVALPAIMKLTPRATWFISLLNVFSGGVFFTFGVMHLFPDALEAQADVGFDRWPLAAFFVVLGFTAFFFLQKALAPSLGLGHDGHSEALVFANSADIPPVKDVEAPEVLPSGDCECGTAAPEATKGPSEAASLLVEGCGCNGNCGNDCGSKCSPDTCPCAKAKTAKAPPQASQCKKSGAAAAAATPAHRRRVHWEYVSPALLMLGVLTHAILEGLAIGLQQSYSAVVVAVVAMASHKWVESVAISARFIKAGAGIWSILGFLVPFSLGPLVGIAIGVNVSDQNSWSILVLFGLIAGLFIYVGTCEITAEEFTALEKPGGLEGKPHGARFWLFAFFVLGVTVVALLQLVPGN